MAAKKRRQTFEKLKREQMVRERRERKQERKAAARLTKAGGAATRVDEETLQAEGQPRVP